MNKTNLVIASILKPVTDTRAFEKVALSLQETNKYEINIIGFHSKILPSTPNIRFHGLFKFNRLSPGRVFAPFHYFLKLRELKPEVIIIGTHELLWASMLYKWWQGTSIVYDIQENYYLNIRYQRNFPAAIRTVLAHYVRWKEKYCARWIDQFLLAEDSYAEELSFTGKDAMVIKNTFQGNAQPYQPLKIIAPKFVFTGTLAVESGAITAIDLFEKIQTEEPEACLRIVGHAPDKDFLHRLNERAKANSSITLIGGTRPVEHGDILSAIEQADIGIVAYAHNRSIDRCMPTKVYEYMALGLPMIIEENRYWSAICHQHQAAIAINFEKVGPASLLKQLRSASFYPHGIPKEILWATRDQQQLQQVIAVLGK